MTTGLQIIAVSLVVCGVAAEARAGSESAKLAIVRPGGGFLVADGVSIVPLQILASLPEGTKILKAEVVAGSGAKITSPKLISENALMFWYAPPKKNSAFKESFEVTLTFADGDRSETFPVEIPAPSAPPLDLLVEPTVLDVPTRTARKPITVNATASGREIVGLELTAGPGTLSEPQKSYFEDAIRAAANVGTAELPDDQPSYVLALAAASSSRGFNAKTAGTAVEAPIRLSVEIAPKSELSVEGASNNPPPVAAPADGKTVMENVVVRYGAQVRAYSKKGGKKSEVSVAIPSLISPGVAMAVPGQNVADGGTGMSILVAVPPSPFGGEPLWPEIALEGAVKISEVKIAPDIRALVVKRPDEPSAVAVLLDDERAATIEFGARHGVDLEMAATYAKSDERGAVEVWVKDSSGIATDLPVPKIKTKDGVELEPKRIDTGKYRAVIEARYPGAAGTTVEVIAEIPPPPFVSGEAMEHERSTAKVKLGGTGGPVGGNIQPKDETRVTTPRPVESDGVEARFSIGATAEIGTTFSKLFLIGGGVMAELRPPVLDARFAIRAGITFEHFSGSGTVTFVDDTETKTLIAGLMIPFDLGFAVVSGEDFELVLRGGGSLRFENGVLRANGDTIAGANRVGFGAHATVEAAITAGGGALVLGGTIGGIGATAQGFSANDKNIEGALTSVRLDVGYKFWF